MYPTAAAASSLDGDGCSGNGVGRRVMVMGSARGVVVGDGLLFLVDEDGARGPPPSWRDDGVQERLMVARWMASR
ncbi:hypothetical protein Dimus_034237 [Dionaea muscipula]